VIRAKTRDANEREIVDALEGVGATVVLLEPSVPGLPDLLIGYQKKTFLQEVKNPDGRNRVDPAQLTFHRLWRGAPIEVVHNTYESLRHIGAMEPWVFSA
jgi:hypothetical protein